MDFLRRRGPGSDEGGAFRNPVTGGCASPLRPATLGSHASSTSFPIPTRWGLRSRPPASVARRLVTAGGCADGPSVPLAHRSPGGILRRKAGLLTLLAFALPFTAPITLRDGPSSRSCYRNTAVVAVEGRRDDLERARTVGPRDIDHIVGRGAGGDRAPAAGGTGPGAAKNGPAVWPQLDEREAPLIAGRHGSSPPISRCTHAHC